MCSAGAERDAHFMRDDGFALWCALRAWKKAQWCIAPTAQYITVPLSQHHLPERANITLYKPLKICYNWYIKVKGGKHVKKRKNNLVLFLQFFGVLFVGFCLCNICSVAIGCIFNGFDVFLTRVIDLPYLLYLILSLIISAVWILIIRNKLK